VKLQNSVLRLFKVSLFALSMSLLGTSSAQAINFYSLQWTGTGDFSMTGLVSGNDDDNNGILQTSNLFSNNEFVTFDVTFKDSSLVTLKTYNINQFPNLSPTFNFNLQFTPTTATVLQGGNAQSGTGFSIGSTDPGDVLLDTRFGQGITLTDPAGFGDDGGNLIATPVPFEFDATAGIVTLGAIWGVNQWRKNRLKK